MSTPSLDDNPLGAFLRDRRERLDPAALGFPTARRRTPGLRREEVAQRANMSATWYTWLEQGRGGAPSADALDRVAEALALTPAEREHLFLLGIGRPPDVREHAPGQATPRLQRVLDALELSPAVVKTPEWDIVAWNRAAAAVLTDYSTLAPAERNVLRLLFGEARIRASLVGWEAYARLAVASFRLETARAGAGAHSEAGARTRALVADLSRTSPDFAAMWRDNDVSAYGEGTKHIEHPVAGPLALEYSAYAVEGQPDLTLAIYTPATEADREQVRRLVAGWTARSLHAGRDASRAAGREPVRVADIPV